MLLPIDIRRIAKRVSEGERLLVILTAAGISPLTFFEHFDKYPEDKILFEKAKVVETMMALDELPSLLDGVDTKLDLEIAKAKIALRTWLAEKLIPSTYGTRIEHNVSGTIDIRAALAEATKRIVIPSTVVEPIALPKKDEDLIG